MFDYWADLVVHLLLLNSSMPATFPFIFSLQSNFAILQLINVKNVHIVSGVGIQSHSLLIMSLLP